MENFIYTKENCLNRDFCNQIIEHFENNNKQNSCNTNTLSVNPNNKFIEFESKIINTLKNEINNYMQIYGKFLGGYDKKDIYTNHYCIYKIKNTNVGYTQYVPSRDNTIINFIFYLSNNDQLNNDILLDSINIIPKEGMLVLFPADWTLPYRIFSRLNEDKYILKGEIVFV